MAFSCERCGGPMQKKDKFRGSCSGTATVLILLGIGLLAFGFAGRMIVLGSGIVLILVGLYVGRRKSILECKNCGHLDYG